MNQVLSLQAAQKLISHNRAEGLDGLNKVFRNGRPPELPLSGRYQGELVALDLMPGLTELFQSLARSWMPWRGKTFDASHERGDNIFTQDSYPIARVFNPFYRGFITDQPGTYRGFAFRTYVASGLMDPDCTVLKIDYDLKENPALTVRRVLDELVQIDDNLYLGKAHVRWWWGKWQTVAYFTLRRDTDPSLAQFEEMELMVVQEEGSESGRTKPASGGSKIKVAISADRERFEQILLTIWNWNGDLKIK